MKLADQIRKYVIDEYINPSREQGTVIVKVRAGDIHKEMGFVNRMPAICGALDTQIFKDKARVQLVTRIGPDQGSTAEWVFRINR